MVGHQIARYQILEQIGSGGMSVVYRGLDTSLEREVAVKVLHPHLALKLESRKRFSQEARAVAKLKHPNILEIFDFSGGNQDDASPPFIITEYIRGVTLRAFAEQTPFHPPEIAAMVIYQLACALEHAHSSGIIHRDIKPDNVMISNGGAVKLMDFGIAKILDRDEKMTVTGALVGSPAHMAPEMIEGLEAGREADIFSLGTIFFWLCCGRLPFVGKSTTQTLKLILEARYPDPRLTAPAVSDEISSVLATCLAKNPEARFPSAGALQKTLADILRSQGITNIDHELSSFFSSPSEYSKSLEQNLISRWMSQAEHFLQGPKRNLPQGLDRLNRVLSLRPCHSEASRLISTIKTRRRKQRWLVATVTSIGCIILLLLIWGTLRKKTPPPELIASQPAQPSPNSQLTQAINSLKKKSLLHKSKQVTIPSVTKPATTNISAHVSEKSKPTDATRFLSNTSISLKTNPVNNSDTTSMRKIAIKIRPQQYARIYLDQKLLNPHSPTFEGQIPVGKHQLKIESDYSWPIEQEIDVLSATDNAPLQQFVIDLEQKPALLVIKSSLKDMRFLINGMPSSGSSGDSETDPVPVPLPEGHLRGKAKIRAFRSGYRDYELTADFTAGKVKELSIELEKQ